jgi:hypothetical protein
MRRHLSGSLPMIKCGNQHTERQEDNHHVMQKSSKLKYAKMTSKNA